MKPLIVDNLTFGFDETPLCQPVSFTLQPGESLWVDGVSGVGKSTCLSILAMRRKPLSGSVSINDTYFDLNAKWPDPPPVCFVPQQPHLLPHRTVLDNLRLRARYAGIALTDAAIRAHLEAFGLEALASQRAMNCSGGESQRLVLIAAMLSKQPVIVADEPTAALDAANQTCFLSAMLSHIEQTAKQLIWVSHQKEGQAQFSQVMSLNPLTVNQSTQARVS